MTTKHTPLPWRVCNSNGKLNPDRPIYIWSGDTYIGKVYGIINDAKGAETIANAHLIDRACSAHHALVEACQSLLHYYQSPDRSKTSNLIDVLIPKLEQALTLAKE